MGMKAPLHPGALVKENLDDLGLGVADAARGLGVTRRQLYNVIDGKSAVTPEMALRLEKAFGGTAATWLQMQVNFDLDQARKRVSTARVKAFGRKVA